MRLEPLYTVTFTTPEAWSVEVAADAGIEGRSGKRQDRRQHWGSLCSNTVDKDAG
jgi:hypothetical protein